MSQLNDEFKRMAIIKGIIRFLVSDRCEAFAIRDGLSRQAGTVFEGYQRDLARVAVGVAMGVSDWLQPDDIKEHFHYCCNVALDAYLLGTTDNWLSGYHERGRLT
jgi:hypothetical protein